MELTKEQKIELIEKAIILLEEKKEYFICVAIKRASGYKINDTFKLIPNLLKYKPGKNHYASVWFKIDEEGYKKRIEICKKVIKDLQNNN
jgi:hypothetical protein